MPEPRPAPLLPSDVDLRSFRFMPLDVLRLRDSDLAAVSSGEQFKAAVLLWCAAWHQVPAGSVPNDERWLAMHSGAGDRWPEVRTEALRGFVQCSDGRLYHEVVAEKALESWKFKLAQRERTKSATEARLRRDVQRDEQRNVNSQRNVERNVENSQRDVLRDEPKSPRNVHQGTGTLYDKKPYGKCQFDGCQIPGTLTRSTNGSGPWFCEAHFEPGNGKDPKPILEHLNLPTKPQADHTATPQHSKFDD